MIKIIFPVNKNEKFEKPLVFEGGGLKLIPIKVTLLFKAILQFRDSKLEKFISSEKYSLIAILSIKDRF